MHRATAILAFVLVSASDGYHVISFETIATARADTRFD
jgi:hypothetical protein